MEPKLPPQDPDPSDPPIPGPNPDEPEPDVYPFTDPATSVPQRMRTSQTMKILAACVMAVTLGACQTQQRNAEVEHAREEANATAQQLSQDARHYANEAKVEGKKAAHELDREVNKEAREAHEEWRDVEHKIQERKESGR